MTGAYVVPSGGECPECGKRMFTDKHQAKQAIRAMKGRVGRLQAYRCGLVWHIGHPPPALTAGVITRDDLDNSRRRNT